MKQKYTKEYKLQALELVNQLGSYAEAARQLGIKDTILHTWKNKLNFVMKKDSEKIANQNPESAEIKRLKKEVEDLKSVNYILKRAAAFFSQDHLK
jgi:transposase